MACRWGFLRAGAFLGSPEPAGCFLPSRTPLFPLGVSLPLPTLTYLCTADSCRLPKKHPRPPLGLLPNTPGPRWGRAGRWAPSPGHPRCPSGRSALSPVLSPKQPAHPCLCSLGSCRSPYLPPECFPKYTFHSIPRPYFKETPKHHVEAAFRNYNASVFRRHAPITVLVLAGNMIEMHVDSCSCTDVSAEHLSHASW